MTLQPPVQQSGRHESHEQCFYDRNYLMTYAGSFRWVEDFDTMADLCDDRLFKGLESSFKFWCPFESTPLADKWFEWCHNVTQLCIVRNLIDEAKPAVNVHGRCWRRGWRLRTLQGLDGFVRYAEPCAKSAILRAKCNFSALRTIPAWPTRTRKPMVLNHAVRL